MQEGMHKKLFCDNKLILRRKLIVNGGEAGIRTLDRLLTYAGFQDRCIQPLCHLSADRDRDRGRILGDSLNGFNYSDTLPLN